MTIRQEVPDPPLLLVKQGLKLPRVMRSTLDGALITISGGGQSGIRVNLGGHPLFDMTNWQYHLLRSLFELGDENGEAAQAFVKERFGLTPKITDIRRFILQMNDLGLLDHSVAARHRLLRDVLDEGTVDAPDPIEEARQRSVEAGAAGAARAKSRKGWPLFRPMRLLKWLRPLSVLGMFALIALPPMMVLATFFAVQNWDLVTTNFQRGHREFDLVMFILLGLLTVNLVATTVQAFAVYAMTGTVEAVVVRFYLGFVPRLALWIDDTDKLSRRQAMWMHAAPLFARLFMASGGILMWNATRYLGGQITDLSLAVAGIAFLSFVITACPFLKGSGYRILVEFFDEPNLRAKAAKAMFGAFRPGFYQLANNQVLLAYGMVSVLFTILVVTLAFLVIGERVTEQIGANGYIVLAVLFVAFVWRVVQQLRTTNDLYWKSYRFERWRERTLPSEEMKKIERKSKFTMWRVIQLMLVTLFVLVLLQPYPYRPSGAVTLLPAGTQELSTDVEAVVSMVHFEGGEYVTQGTLIAELNSDDLQGQLRVREAELAEQRLALDFRQRQLRTRPAARPVGDDIHRAGRAHAGRLCRRSRKARDDRGGNRAAAGSHQAFAVPHAVRRSTRHAVPAGSARQLPEGGGAHRFGHRHVAVQGEDGNPRGGPVAREGWQPG